MMEKMIYLLEEENYFNGNFSSRYVLGAYTTREQAERNLRVNIDKKLLKGEKSLKNLDGEISILMYEYYDEYKCEFTIYRSIRAVEINKDVLELV